MSALPPSPLPEHHVSEAMRRRGLLFLGIASAAVGLAITLQLGLNDNFLAGELKLTGEQKGYVEAFRESCGIIALWIMALLAGLAEPYIAAAMLAVFGIGLASYFGVYAFWPLVLMSVIWSQGLHVWMPLPNSMVLALAEPERTGRRMGQIQAAGSVGSFAGLAIALLLRAAKVPIRPLYIFAGGVAVLGGLACLKIPRDIKAPGPRLVWRRQYWLYYLLTMLEGWRKQIAIAFGGFLLVKRFDTPLEVMLVLWMAIQAVGWLASSRVGRLIDRVGERKVLIFYYSVLSVAFCGYILLQRREWLWALFVLDGSFFVFAMAITTYVRRIAPISDHTATLSMGVAGNHIAAVSMPAVGAMLWNLGYQWTFATGVVAALASVGVACLVPRHEKLLAQQEGRRS